MRRDSVFSNRCVDLSEPLLIVLALCIPMYDKQIAWEKI